MRGTISIPIKKVARFADQLCRWSRNERYALVLRSNSDMLTCDACSPFSRYEVLAAFGADSLIVPSKNYFDELRDATAQNNWLFGYLGYDLKNEVEKLSSNNSDGLHFPEMIFFMPSIVFAVQDGILNIHYSKDKYNRQTAGCLFDAIMDEPAIAAQNDKDIITQARFTKDEYIDTVNRVLAHIHRGDIYEMNLCQEFYAQTCRINPYETYLRLNQLSPTPFSAFGKFHDKFLLCASPERYLQKQGNRIVSQPIKGTCPRGNNPQDDKQLADKLKNDPKERAENIMIVDLVRNDLSRVAQRGSVTVDELCGVYPFPQVHQLISTVSCNLNANSDIVDLLKATFPMGSMTGAPKVSAMQIAEELERTKRGLYSGTVGYIDSQGNADFNVVIRSLLYNKTKRYLSYSVGGAITSKSNPVQEYSECLLKAMAIEKVLTTS
ncbi:aminodeoxychorismate synthase component I [Perlabentimonas gracilis]|uniref:aminodeoxychorismate synthase component I n=1 Tax=Perlabentimonas gracilis TaxID=2715279 RepID=UPI00140B9BF1|nr:aminodeoxychorismate synthase component I [Perlabentimonas gracilis]NHB69638.1 aminodeoxychorismate synthase component I [Perlabentimonas gracilis]